MQAILFDLDGVIYQDGEAIAGAAQTVAWVQDEKIPHLFLSNTSSHSRSTLVERLARFDIHVAAERILIPPVVAARWLEKKVSGPVALFVPEEAREDFSALDILEETAESGAGAVVVGHLGHNWSYDLLNRAFRLLMATPRPQLIALGMTRYAREADGLSLDVAPFVAALEYASGLDALVLGKPATDFFETARQILGTDAGRTVMIGDDIAGDVGAAQKCGMKGIQVRTGKFRDEDLQGEISPNAVLDSIADLPNWWQRQVEPT
ncbi:MAG: TIGR01458 family HAD-type hydrolase [Desulfuromonadales bacterium]|nr:TIGR01458 family HAD-type hydrolase [Desulfuromonadales bacterium]NIR33854.1 TIGR01458 family HAD-type hydrolase [Desulfuromonadales bacterium]NIS40005.1 TIGR01458 family HAD-type hydrolase [Desulfuromonadales bacterium]